MNLPDRPVHDMLSSSRPGSASSRAWLSEIGRSFCLGATEHAYPLHVLLPASVRAAGIVVGKIDKTRVRVGNLHACLLALAVAGCKHVSELQAASHTDAATAAEVATHEIISAGPEHIIMTVEEYEQLCPGAAALPAGESAQAASGAPPRPEEGARLPSGKLAPSQPASPFLIRRVTTVTDRGPSLDDLRSLSTLQSKVNTALEVKEEKKSGPAGLLGLLGSLWPVVLIGGAILAVVVVLKLKPPWLSFLFKLLGRTP